MFPIGALPSAGWRAKFIAASLPGAGFSIVSRVAFPEIVKPLPADNMFQIRLGDLPDEVFERVRAELRHFAVPLMLNDDFIGSGVLVEIDGVPFILTAEHVVNNPRTPFDNSLDSAQVLVTSVSEKANAVAIEMRNLTWWTYGRRLSNEWGPDLAFIRLPKPAGFTRQLRASKSFYNLTKDPAARMKEASEELGFMAFVGYVAEQTAEVPPESGFRDVKRIQGYAFQTGPETHHQIGAFDYVDVGCDRLFCPAMPRSFGGVSGGGLWRYDVLRKKDEAPGQEKLGNFYLAGVVFREDDINTDKPTVRAHGAASIYDACLPAVRAWLKT